MNNDSKMSRAGYITFYTESCIYDKYCKPWKDVAFIGLLFVSLSFAMISLV